MTALPPSDPYAGPPAPPSLAPGDAQAAPAAPAAWTEAGPAVPARPSEARGWVIAAMILFWPLAIPAYLASQRSARALGAGDLPTAERESRSARAFGIAAVAVAVVWTLLSVVVGAAFVATAVRTFEDASGFSLEEALDPEAPAAQGGGPAGDGADLPPGPAGEKTWAELAVGDCFDVPDIPEESFTVPLVPCDEPHVSEVFAVTELPEGEWPGLAQVDEQAFDFCIEQFTAFVGEPYEDSSLFTWPSIPTEESWYYGDRSVACVVEPAQGTVTGTLEGFAAGDNGA